MIATVKYVYIKHQMCLNRSKSQFYFSHMVIVLCADKQAGSFIKHTHSNKYQTVFIYTHILRWRVSGYGVLWWNVTDWKTGRITETKPEPWVSQNNHVSDWHKAHICSSERLNCELNITLWTFWSKPL